MPQSNDIEIRSEEVQEILTRIPGWIVRWGITVIFITVGLLLLASWFIKYPDTISANVVLTTQTPPVEMIARSSGRLNFFVKDYEEVKEGEFLALIENPSHADDIFYLISKLEEIKKTEFSQKEILHPDSFKVNLELGQLQDNYVEFRNALRDYALFQQLNLYEKQMEAIQSRINSYRQLNLQLEKQNAIVTQELALSKRKYNIDSVLFNQKVIADLDFDQSKNSYLQTKRVFESARSDIINNQILASGLKAQVLELSIEQQKKEDDLKNAIRDAYKRLESQLSAWEEQYLLEAPLDGKVAFLKYWSDNQYVKEGEEVMTIIPYSQDVLGQVLMPISGSGKVEVGQRVNIRFDNYPSNEYGMVIGKVESVGLLPRDNMYSIRISLPQGLITSYGKKLEFRQEMQGSAEIVTRDMRLIGRIFNQFRTLMDRAN